MRLVFEIMKKELLRWSGFPIFYLLFSFLLFGVGVYTWFFKNLLLNVDAIMPMAFQAMFWGIAITIPILATGLILEERKYNTLQTLLTRPITIKQIVLGKLLAIKVIIFSFFLLTAIYYLSISFLVAISLRYVLLIYLFLFLEGIVYAVISMLIASFVKVYWKSYLYTYLIVLSLHFFVTFIGEMSVGEIQNFFFYIGIQSHFNYFLEGGFALSSIFYLVSIIGIGFYTIVYKLSRENL